MPKPLWMLVMVTVASVLPANGQGIVLGSRYAQPKPIRVAPGQVMTFFVSGLHTGVTTEVRAPGFPLPHELAGVSATFKQGVDFSLPLFAVKPLATCLGQEPGCAGYLAITVQIPFGIPYANGPNMRVGTVVPTSQIVFSAAASGTTARVNLDPWVDNLHILASCDVLLSQPTWACEPIATHGDGSPITPESPAKAGEKIVLWAFGAGPTTPGVLRGEATLGPAPTVLPFTVSFDARPNASPSRPFLHNKFDVDPPSYIGLTPGFAGLYQINVTIPTLPGGVLSPCSSRFVRGNVVSNLTINIGGPSSFDGAAICVQAGPP